MDWARILAYITGTVDQELLSRNEYLVTENRILKRQLKGRLLLSDAERATLGEFGHRLGRKALADVATAAKPDTILGWYRRLVARKFDGSRQRRHPRSSPSGPHARGDVLCAEPGRAFPVGGLPPSVACGAAQLSDEKKLLASWPDSGQN